MPLVSGFELWLVSNTSWISWILLDARRLTNFENISNRDVFTHSQISTKESILPSILLFSVHITLLRGGWTSCDIILNTPLSKEILFVVFIVSIRIFNSFFCKQVWIFTNFSAEYMNLYFKGTFFGEHYFWQVGKFSFLNFVELSFFSFRRAPNLVNSLKLVLAKFSSLKVIIYHKASTS